MNVVLYTTDFEPITVLDLPMWLLDQLEKTGAVKVAVQQPLSIKEITNLQETLGDTRTVTIYCEKLRWKNGTIKTVLVTPDEELLLLAKPAWLPGQTATIQANKLVIRSLTQKLIKAMRK